MGLRGQDAWRRHPVLKWGVWDLLPGIRQGAGLFAVYVAAEYAYDKTSGGGGHGHEGHGGAHASHAHGGEKKEVHH